MKPNGQGAQTEAHLTPAYQNSWTVSELTQRIKSAIEPQFTEVWIRGEVSNYRPAASGHAYFSLKDTEAMISAVVFGWGARRKRPGGFDLKDGLEVLGRGRISLYPVRGSYQIVLDSLEPLGAGALQLAFEELKARLQEEGLFAPGRKRQIPSHPTRIAVITSPTGAVIRDILNVLGRRAPHIQVTVIPSVVQGDSAVPELLRGLEQANRFQLGQVIILARGGGSFEDLWCFNDERLARAIATSAIPVLSAVGHETDFTICDFVSDLRAPTPSAAAEIVSQGWMSSIQNLKDQKQRLWKAVKTLLQMKRLEAQRWSGQLVSPKDRLQARKARAEELRHRLDQSIDRLLENKRTQWSELSIRLDALSPFRVLKRGFSLIEDARRPGVVISSQDQVHSNQEISIRFHDGQVSARIL